MYNCNLKVQNARLQVESLQFGKYMMNIFYNIRISK